MLRPNGYSGKVRASDRLSLPYCAIDAKETRHSTGYVSPMPAGATGLVLSGRQKQSSVKDLRRRCRVSQSAVLDAVSFFHPVHDSAPTSNGASVGRGSRCYVRRLGKKKESAGAIWVTTPRYSGATGTTGRTPVHDARTGTTLPRTRTTTSVGAASVSALQYRFVVATARQADQSTCGQPGLSSFGEYASGSGIAPSSETSKSAASVSMGKKYRNLIDQITTIENLRDAYQKTAKNKRMTFGYLEFKEYAEANLLRIQQELKDGGYKIGPYREFTIYEPKARLISALDFKDRLVQHALCNVISPIFDKGLLPYTFACRVGMGTHAGVRHVQSMLRSTNCRYFLKTDFAKFFPSVDRPRLHEMIDKKVRCEKTLAILREIIPTQGVGIPIGSLTSQLFANVYGNAVDRFIHFDLGHRNWARYMDDIIILDHDADRLRQSFHRIQEFADLDMKMVISKWQVSPVSRGVNFLGYRIWPTHKLLRKDSVIRAKRKVEKFVRHKDAESLNKFIASWTGHAQWADTQNLFKWMEEKYNVAF